MASFFNYIKSLTSVWLSVTAVLTHTLLRFQLFQPSRRGGTTECHRRYFDISVILPKDIWIIYTTYIFVLVSSASFCLPFFFVAYEWQHPCSSSQTGRRARRMRELHGRWCHFFILMFLLFASFAFYGFLFHSSSSTTCFPFKLSLKKKANKYK